MADWNYAGDNAKDFEDEASAPASSPDDEDDGMDYDDDDDIDGNETANADSEDTGADMDKEAVNKPSDDAEGESIEDLRIKLYSNVATDEEVYNETVNLLEQYCTKTGKTTDSVCHELFGVWYDRTYDECNTNKDSKFGVKNTQYLRLLAKWLQKGSIANINGVPTRNCYQFVLCANGVMWNYIFEHESTRDRGEKVKDLILLPTQTCLRERLQDLKAVEGRQLSASNLASLLSLAFTVIDGVDIEPEKRETEEEKKPINTSVQKMVNALLNEILNTYENLYAPCFAIKPDGVLFNGGLLTFRDGNIIEESDPYLKKLYNFVQSYSKNGIKESSMNYISSKMINSNCELLQNYVPKFSVLCAFGLMESNGKLVQEQKWNVYKEYLRKNLYKMLIVIFENFSGDLIKLQSKIKDLFTNCILVNKFDRETALQMTYKFDSIEGIRALSTEIAKNAGNTEDGGLFGIGEGAGKLISHDMGKFNINNMLYVFDNDLFQGDVLFAYKAIEDVVRSGGKITTRNMIIGRDMSGKNFTVDMETDRLKSAAVVGESGSGKGVLTLSMLATIVASNSPFAYLDFKPDMAAVLWDMERGLASKGCGSKILAIDALSNRHKFGTEPVRKFEFGYKGDCDALTVGIYSLIPYLKLMQLSALTMYYRNTGLLMDVADGNKFYIILDEGQAFNRSYTAAYTSILGMLKKIPKKDLETSATAKYLNKWVDAYGTELGDNIANVMTTTGRQGKGCFILLGQQGDPANWTDGVNPWAKSLFGQILSNCSLKISGSNSGNSTMYGISGMDCDGIDMVKNAVRGYFVKGNGVKSDNDCNVFKSYLVLNKNDIAENPDGFAANLVKNIGNPHVRDKVLNTDLYQNGAVNDRVGFEGLMRYIAKESGVNIESSIGTGYELIWKTMQQCGLADGYSSIEEYLYDCSLASIFTFGELRGVVSKEKSEGAEGEEPEGNGGVNFGTFAKEGNAGATGANGENGANGAFATANGEEAEPESAFTAEEFDKNGYGTENFTAQPQVSTEPVGAEWGSATAQPAEDFQPVNTRRAYNNGNVFEDMLDIYNPYENYNGKVSPAQMMMSMTEVSRELLESIRVNFGSFDRIRDFRIDGAGGMYVNGIAYRPKFPETFINSLPIDIRGGVASGNLAEVFRMCDIYKFKQLVSLTFDSVEFAEGRVRNELCLPKKQGWKAMFKYLHSLSCINIGGKAVKQFDDEEYENGAEKDGWHLQERLRNAFRMPSISTSSVGRAFQNKRVPKVAKAAGVVLGVGAMFWVASVLGIWALPIGLLMGNRFKKD